MADDINKKISIDVEVNTDGQQQINQYKASFDSLRTSIDNLGKPITDLATNISSLDKDLSKLSSSVDKYSAKMLETSQKASDQQAKINVISNQKLKTSLSEAEKINEQALIKELQLKSNYYGGLALKESEQYAQQKKNLDRLLQAKGISQLTYNKEVEKLSKEHYDHLRQIMDQYIKDKLL